MRDKRTPTDVCWEAIMNREHKDHAGNVLGGGQES